MRAGLLLLLAGFSLAAQVVNPVLPQVTVDASRPGITGSTIAVHAGDNLQLKYNAASCGDTLVLDEGAVFTGAFVFDKPCTPGNWIQIVSSGLALIPNTDYVACQMNVPTQCPEPATTHYATIRNTVTGSPISTASDNSHEASYHYFGGLEVTTTTLQYQLIDLGNNGGETSANQFGTHLTFDKMYIHGLTTADSSHEVLHGILGQANYVAIVNSYVTNIYSMFDTQAIGIRAGMGWYIHNNFLAAAAENILAGGYATPPGWTCNISASPAPTTTTATVTGCLNMENGAGGGSTPAVGTLAMFTSGGTYNFAYYAQITGNTAGALTFARADNGAPLPSAPDSGTAKVQGGLVPTDITITHNSIYKPIAWRPVTPGDTLDADGIRRCTKNLGEAKIGYRWLIEGNWMENSFDTGCGGQPGFGFDFKSSDQNGNCPWCHSTDITFRNNVLKNIGTAFIISPCEAAGTFGNACLQRLLIRNNLFWPSTTSPQGGQGVVAFGAAFTSGGGALNNSIMDSVQVIRNNLLGPGNFMAVGTGYTRNYRNLVWRDNLTQFDQYRMPATSSICPTPNIDGSACVTALITGGVATWSASNNAVVNSGAVSGAPGTLDDASLRTRYGSIILNTLVDSNVGMNYSGVGFASYLGVNNDYHNFQLTSGSAFSNLASDGKDPGVDFAALDAALQGSNNNQATIVTITSPTSNPNFTTSNSIINLAGTAFDPAGITQVTWATDLGASGVATGASNWTISGLNLSAGITNVTVTARNATGNQVSTTLALTYTTDSTPPVIAITSPTSSGSYSTSSGAVNLGGTASDDVGVTQVTWATDTGAAGTATGTSSWNITGVPVSGTTQITVTAHDAAGNVSKALLTVTSTFTGVSDTTPPTIAITSPTSSSSFTASSSTISLGGTASDNTGVTQITWSTDKGASGFAVGTTSWTINGLTLASGATLITVTASDAGGNVASRTLTVTYSAPDTTAPTIAITAPTAGTTFSAPGTSVTLSGIAADNIGVTQVAWVTDRGASGVASGTTSWSTGGIALGSGSTQITVTAYDKAGNTASAVLAVTTPLQTDTTPPTVSITSPTSASTFSTAGTTITLSGTAADNVGVTQVIWVSSNGSNGIASGTTSWNTGGIPLQSGSNQLTVTARDAAGNRSSAIITVTSTASNSVNASSVVITSPTSGPVYTTSLGTVSLAGTASASAGVIQVTWSGDRGDGSGTAAGTTSWNVNQVNLKNGTNTITVTARDSANGLASQVIQVIYSPPSVKTKNLPKAQAGQPYTYSLDVSGGVPPYSWSASSLPDGMSLSSDGLLSGKPLATGTYDVEIVVHDSAVSDSAVLTLSVDPWVDFVSTATFSPAWGAPQSMLTALGWQLSTGTVAADPGALTTSLSDTTVTVHDAGGKDRLAPLYYVSPDQINFVVPAETALGRATITVASAGRSIVSGTIYVDTVAPSLFEANADGLAAANLLRVRGDYSEYDPISQRDPSTSQVVAIPLDLSSDTDTFYLILYGTGVRFRSSLDSVKATVGGMDAQVVYAGSAGNPEGLDLVSIKLPTEVHGYADIVTTVDGVAANTVRILIK